MRIPTLIKRLVLVAVQVAGLVNLPIIYQQDDPGVEGMWVIARTYAALAYLLIGWISFSLMARAELERALRRGSHPSATDIATYPVLWLICLFLWPIMLLLFERSQRASLDD